MSIKFETRFSPSIIRAAEIHEAGNALFRVPTNASFKAQAIDSFNRGVEQMGKLIDGSGLGFVEALGQVLDCSNEMQMQRRVKAQQRKAQREARVLAKQEAQFA